MNCSCGIFGRIPTDRDFCTLTFNGPKEILIVSKLLEQKGPSKLNFLDFRNYSCSNLSKRDGIILWRLKNELIS